MSYPLSLRERAGVRACFESLLTPRSGPHLTLSLRGTLCAIVLRPSATRSSRPHCPVIKPGGNVERELWIALYRMLRAAAARRAPRPCNWPRELLDFALPSQSTMSRRLRTTSMRDLMAALHAPLGGGSSSSS